MTKWSPESPAASNGAAAFTCARRQSATERQGEGKRVHTDENLTRKLLAQTGRLKEAGGWRTDGGRLQGRQARRPRLGASRLTGLDGKDEGVAAELLGCTEKLWEARNGEAPRRPELGFRRRVHGERRRGRGRREE
jgi:hypothetical protein